MTTLEDRIAQAIAFSLADAAKLPQWMRAPAWGKDMLPLGELAAPAVVAIVNEMLADLRERHVKADATLRNMAHEEAGDVRQRHLESKSQGVRLALSYLDEAMKEAQR